MCLSWWFGLGCMIGSVVNVYYPALGARVSFAVCMVSWIAIFGVVFNSRVCWRLLVFGSRFNSVLRPDGLIYLSITRCYLL